MLNADSNSSGTSSQKTKSEAMTSPRQLGDLSRNVDVSTTSTSSSLDTLSYAGFDVRLFYSGKKLCLELERAGEELAMWTFCSQRRHSWHYDGHGYHIQVVYRPAEVEVRFTEHANSTALARLFRIAPPLKGTWTRYKLGGDGAVKISRPDREYTVC